MNVSCIALDLDGTTLKDDKAVSPATRKAIEEAVAAGIHVVVASGRCLDALPESVTGIPGVEYAITSNGAAVYELKDGTCLRRVTLDAGEVQKIQEVAEGRNLTLEVFCDGVPYGNRSYVEDPAAYGALPHAIDYIQRTRRPVEDIGEFLREHRHVIDGIDLITRNQALREEIWRELEEKIPTLYITSSLPNRVETASRDAGKHQGLHFILNHLGLDAARAAAFGDGDNDEEMLSYVRYGMAVENGSERCKAAAWKVVPSNMEDGVAAGIRLLLSENEDLDKEQI